MFTLLLGSIVIGVSSADLTCGERLDNSLSRSVMQGTKVCLIWLSVRIWHQICFVSV